MQTYLLVSSLINTLSTLFFGFIVFTRGRKQKLNQAFLVFAVTILVWSVSYFFWQNSSTYDQALFWTRMLMLGAIFIAPTYLLFVTVFLRNYNRWRVLIWSTFILAAVFSVFSFSPHFVSGLSRLEGLGLWPTPGTLYSLFLGSWIIETIIAFILLVQGWRKEKDDLRRTQFKYLFVGLAVAFIGGYTNFPLWYGIDVKPIGNIFVTFFIVAMAMTVLKHKLMDIKVVATEVIVAVLLLISITEVVLAESTSEIALKIFTTLVIAVFSVLLTKSVYAEVSQREQLQKLTGKLRKSNNDLMLKNRYLSALQSLTNEITRSLNFKKFTQDIVNGVSSKLDFVGGVLFLLDEQDKKLKVSAITNSRVIGKALKYLPNDPQNYYGDFEDDNTLTILAMRTGRVQIGSDLYNFISPPIPKGTSTVIQSALRARSFMAVPIFADDKPIGCLVVGSRAPKSKITQTAVDMIKAFGDEVGIMARNLRLYEQLDKANEKLRAANKELSKLDKAKTEFLSIASHQLRTPLTAIKGYISMIMEGDFGKPPKKLKEPLKEVHESTERLIVLVNDLLDVSRIASGRLELHLEPLDIREITEDVIKELEPKANNKKIDLVTNDKLSPKTQILADNEKIRQVIINLIDNAIKYTDEGGVKITYEKDGDVVRFTVEDSGIGITEEELTQLFRRFVRAKEAKLTHTQGTGLGLYVAKTMTEAMNGKIWAESDGLGKGSRFIFEIPMASKNAKDKIVKVPPRQDYVSH